MVTIQERCQAGGFHLDAGDVGDCRAGPSGNDSLAELQLLPLHHKGVWTRERGATLQGAH